MKRTNICRVLSVLTVFLLLNINYAQAQPFSGGAGTAAGPYQITTQADLEAITTTYSFTLQNGAFHLNGYTLSTNQQFVMNNAAATLNVENSILETKNNFKTTSGGAVVAGNLLVKAFSICSFKTTDVFNNIEYLATGSGITGGVFNKVIVENTTTQKGSYTLSNKLNF